MPISKGQVHELDSYLYAGRSKLKRESSAPSPDP